MRDKWYLQREGVMLGIRIDAPNKRVMIAGRTRWDVHILSVAQSLDLDQGKMTIKKWQNKIQMHWENTEVDVKKLEKTGWALTLTKSFRRLTR